MFDKSSAAFRHVNSADVRLTIAGQPPVAGVVYLAFGQRLSDLLNDQRAFIPVRLETGETMIVAKNQIASIAETQGVVEPTDQDNSVPPRPSQRKGFDPYAVLRIPRDADLDAVRAAYKTRIKAVHPDTVAALDLDDDLSRAALLAAQKVNYAYKKIMRERSEDAVEPSE